MIGAAVENLILNLRDDLVPRLKKKGIKYPKEMESWVLKTALEKVADLILPDLKGDKRELYEDASSRLFPLANDFRKTRNADGHPAGLDPVSPSDVHSNLLLFPSTAKLIDNIKTWVSTFYV